jgi:KaiC/GvpD/RAD55 family RecA-like ATPase
MGTVRSLNPAKGLEEFCDFLYGEEEAFVHLPIKYPENDRYEYNFFFKWPQDRQDILDHVERYSNRAEVFMTPGMFKSRSSNVTESHGSYVAWTDFDGNVPSLEELKEACIPEPSLRVQSSTPGHEHWYWRYDQFNTDITSIQGINKSICYALKGDTGAWDAGHSLRPVGSLNHKNDGDPLPVIIKRYSEYSYSLEAFKDIEVPQDSYNLEAFKREKGRIPGALRTMLRYGPWPESANELMSKGYIAQGGRSTALAKLTYFCCEQGLDNSEVFSVIQWADKRWKKFFNRPDKEKYYVDLINFARQKIPYEGIKDVPVLAGGLEIYSFDEMLKFQDDTQWLIENILPAKGVAYIVGRSGVGKTTLALGICTYMAVGKNYLDWNPVNPGGYKVLFLSLEMNSNDVSKFYNEIQVNYTEEERQLLTKNFYTYSQPEKVKLWQGTSPTMGKFLRTLEDFKPDIVLVDSASFSLASNLNNQEEVTKSIEIIDAIRDRYSCSFVFIHHSRKEPPSSGYKEADLDDVFGSGFIAASAATIISLKQAKDYEDNNRMMDVKYLKSRFSADNAGFSVKQTDRRIFVRPTLGELVASVKVPAAKKGKEKDEDDGDKSFFNF